MGRVPYYIVTVFADNKTLYVAYQDEAKYFYITEHEGQAERFYNIPDCLTGLLSFLKRVLKQDVSMHELTDKVVIHRRMESLVYPEIWDY